MEQSRSLPMCKSSGSESPASGGGAAVTYTAFLDALLTNVCCGDIGNSDAYDSAADFVISGDEDGVIGGSSQSPNNGRGDDEDGAATIDQNPLAEPILPHLRFNPLINSSASTLDEFYDLFLRNDAPHSFVSFHKSKGDEEVNATPWEMGQEEDKLERTITFITKFTPKNLQEDQDVGAPTPSSTITDVNNPTLTLAVTSHQTLSRQPSTMILESLLSFDFVDYSLLKTSLSKILNVSLTQFLISDDVKGSEVKVRIVLNEEDGGITTSTGVQAASSGKQQPPVSHPFLLPDRLPNEHENHDESDNNTDFSPTQLGASLLSLIRARNSPTPPDSTSSKRSPVDEAALLIAKHSESIKGSPKLLLERDMTDDTYDVLRTGSSRGSLLFKHVSSFETSVVNPGEMAMRRILWEKDRSGTATRSESNILHSNASEGGDPSKLSSLLQPFDLSSRGGGLSMHIEMEVRDNSSFNNNNDSSSNNNTTFRRSASLTNRTRSDGNSSFQRARSTGIGGSSATYIEEKVRKGLKKRVARSSVTWATSWCCRLWEDEQMERFLKRGNPTPTVRKRSNTRPTVRRIGERRRLGGRIGKNQTAPNNTEMEKLQAMKKQIQQAESIKKQPPRPRVVTPPSSPTHEEEGSAWVPLQLEDGNECCRWMPSVDEEGHCGVEVCTISPSEDDESKRSKESGSGMKKKFVRGLKTSKS